MILRISLSLACTAATGYAGYRLGWHRARIFTDPRWRRWMNVAFALLELSAAVQGRWWAVLATIMFAGFAAVDFLILAENK